MASLVSVAQLKAANGDNQAPGPGDVKYELAANAASELVRNFTGLKFEVAEEFPMAETRLFEYDNSGYLDIDEAQLIESISMTGGYTGSLTRNLTTDEWNAHPFNKPVKLWLRLPSASYGGISREMGFTYNLDTYEGPFVSRPSTVAVTAVWGWPQLPADVQQAVIWTALNIVDTPKPYTQESIESYSRTRGSEGGGEAIPDRAQVALMPYVIPRV